MFVDAFKDEAHVPLAPLAGRAAGGTSHTGSRILVAVRLKYGCSIRPTPLNSCWESSKPYRRLGAPATQGRFARRSSSRNRGGFRAACSCRNRRDPADLYDSRPNLQCGSVDGDGVGSVAAGIWNQFVAGPSAAQFVARDTPVLVPWPQNAVIGNTQDGTGGKRRESCFPESAHRASVIHCDTRAGGYVMGSFP